MGHDWVFDVLKDLQSYALANDFPLLAAKAEEALKTARAEILAKSSGGESQEQTSH